MLQLRNLWVVGGLMLSTLTYAQGEMDALKLSQFDIKGSARYMGMAGAFGSLGGDISAIAYNPAGISTYRRSEVSTTMNYSIFNTQSGSESSRLNKFRFDNLGYVASLNLGDGKRFNVGISYTNVKNFNRRVRFSAGDMGGSLVDLMALKANQGGINPNEVLNSKDPFDLGYDWMGVLGFNGYLTNFNNATGLFERAQGLKNLSSSSSIEMTERGGIDQYDITLGGDVNDYLSLGVSIGIIDMDYRLSSVYSEDFGSGKYYDLQNSLDTKGSGFNIKLGAIFKPTDQIRLSLGMHTPTFYRLTDYYSAKLSVPAILNTDENSRVEVYAPLYENSPAYTHYGLNTPFRFMAGAAFIEPKIGLISVDYEYTDYSKSRLLNNQGDVLSEDNDYISADFRSGHTIKAGAEFRLSSQLSLRAGYAYQTSPVQDFVMDGQQEMVTYGTMPHYYMDRSNQYITAGLGYRTNSFYVDLAYVNKQNKQDLWAYTPTFYTDATIKAPNWDVKNLTHSVLMTVGLRF